MLVNDWFYMETNRLKQFCTIVETRNLRKAAELLGISHSGLSKSMRALESETQMRLFLPSGRGLAITDEGMRLYERSDKFFTELDHLLGKTDKKLPNELRIGSFEVFTSYFIGKLLKDYLTDCEVEIHELVPGRLEEALLMNRVDLGITYEPIPRHGIEYVKITRIEMGPYCLQGRFDGQGILDIPFVVPVSPLESAPSGVRGRDGWPEERFKRMIRYRVDLMTTGLELVHQGLCAIFIPKFVAELHNKNSKTDHRLRLITLPSGFPPIKREIYIVKRESTPETKAIRTIARALREIC